MKKEYDNQVYKVVVDGERGNAAPEKTADSQHHHSKRTTAVFFCITTIIVIAALIVCGKYIYELYKYHSAAVPEETVLEYTGQEYHISDIEFATDPQFECVVAGNYETMSARGQYAYTVTLSLEHAWFVKSRVYNVAVLVEDTTPPVFDIDCPTAITVTKDCRIGSLKKYFTVSDMTKVTLSIDSSTYDLTAIGRYPTQVVATDEDGNESSLDITVNVVSPKVTIAETECNLTVGQSITLTPTVTGKDKTVTWKSDDESIAKVDENGRVTGVSEGTTKITVSANGVENSIACFVR